MDSRDDQSLTTLHGPPLRDILLGARLDLAEALSAAIGASSLGPRAYLRWMAAERVLCAAGAAALQGMPPAPARHEGWMREKATVLAGQAAMAAADVRRTDGVATTTGIVGLDHWRDYYDLHALARPWRVLGAVALHASAMGGPAAVPVSAVLGLPFMSVRGATYLLHRQLQARGRADDLARLQRLVLEVDARQDLVEGAAFAASSYRDITRAVLGSPAPSRLATRWRFAARAATTGPLA